MPSGHPQDFGIALRSTTLTGCAILQVRTLARHYIPTMAAQMLSPHLKRGRTIIVDPTFRALAATRQRSQRVAAAEARHPGFPKLTRKHSDTVEKVEPTSNDKPNDRQENKEADSAFRNICRWLRGPTVQDRNGDSEQRSEKREQNLQEQRLSI